MNILEQVIEEYSISGIPKPPTDKTDKRASVSSVSDRSGGLKTQIAVDDAVLRAALGDDWDVNDLAQLKAYYRLQMITEMRERGIVPDHYIAKTVCKHCGPVPIFQGSPSKVDGCPWCFNRLAGFPMPKLQRCLSDGY